MNSLSGLKILALLTTLTFAGCSPSGSVKSPAFGLPTEPAYMAPVPVKTFKPGTNAKLIAAQRYKEVKEANSRLVKSRVWYRGVRRAAGGDK